MISRQDYAQIFLSDRPLVDLRAPIEFVKGAFPRSVSLPLMSDDERAKVGTCYKQNGQQAAITLGHQLVSGENRAQKLKDWLLFIDKNPDVLFYCFRGGLRSRVTYGWLKEAGAAVPYIEGGYKGMRQYLIEQLESFPVKPMILLSGMTGSGKTEVIGQLENSIDLEQLAGHRGSSFGKQIDNQPSQISFENRLAVELLKWKQKQQRQLVLESESRMIGRRAIPHSFFAKMKNAPRIRLVDSLDNRIARIFREYVEEQLASYQSHYGEENGTLKFSESLFHSLDQIKKRLGGANFSLAYKYMSDALASPYSVDRLKHQAWIRVLLENYYDPLYEKHNRQFMEQTRFVGNREQVLAWLQQNI